MDTVTIRRPDDWHAHVRDSAMMEAVLPYTAKRFARAIIMPNLAPKPVVTAENARAYRERLETLLPENSGFTPLMTLYLTDNTSPTDVEKAFREKIAHAMKLYPAGATTNSDQGVTDIRKTYPVLETMQKIGMPLLVHGEALRDKSGNRTDPYDREKIFIEDILSPLLKDLPGLKVVLEHVTTKDGADFVLSGDEARLAATLTVHHLMLERADMFEGGLQPHYYCLPVIKRREHREALRKAATSGDPRFFLGTDSAPHPTSAKERATGCAGGLFTAPAAIELYAQVFEEEGRLGNLEKFASTNGPGFYGLPVNEETVTLTKELWTIDSTVPVGNGDTIRPFGYHEDPAKRLQIRWKLAD